MPDWAAGVATAGPPAFGDPTAFASVTGVVLAFLLILAHATRGAVETRDDRSAGPHSAALRPGAGDAPLGTDDAPVDVGSPDGNGDGAHTVGDDGFAQPTDEVAPTTDDGERRPNGRVSPADAEPASPARPESPGVRRLSTGALLANVALSHGVLGGVLVVAAVLAEVPPGALGVSDLLAGRLAWPLAAGTVLGVALFGVNQGAARAADVIGVDYSDELRAMLAPSSIGGWLVLLAVVLPAVAAFEELLFRAAAVGAMAAGFGVSPWLLAAGSSALFALGHGLQGPGGVAVTGLLGFVLAAAFVVTGSLVVVVVAHYLVNALEFVIHEGLDRERPVGG